MQASLEEVSISLFCEQRIRRPHIARHSLSTVGRQFHVSSDRVNQHLVILCVFDLQGSIIRLRPAIKRLGQILDLFFQL